MTFLEAERRAAGRNPVRMVVFWQTLAVLLPPGSTARGAFGTLDGCLLLELLGRLMAGHVATNGDTARRNARATSLGRVACFIWEGPLRSRWCYLDSRLHGERKSGC